jgi:hypothetical protein
MFAAALLVALVGVPGDLFRRDPGLRSPVGFWAHGHLFHRLPPLEDPTPSTVNDKLQQEINEVKFADSDAPGDRMSKNRSRSSFRKDLIMIIVRNTFRLKFGKAREALAIMKEGLAIQKRAGVDVSQRILTDVTGTFYTMTLELTLPNLAALETMMPKVMGDKDWQANYQKLTPLVESGHREILTIVE